MTPPLPVRWPVRVPPWALDAGLAVGVAVVAVLAIGTANDPGSAPADGLAYGLGVFAGCLVVVRRRWPLGVLFATFGVLYLYYKLDYPGFPPAIILAVALYTAAAAGHVHWALLVIAATSGSEVLAQVLGDEPEPLSAVLLDALSGLTLMLTLALLGDAVRSRRALMSQAQERLRLAAVEREREAQRRVAEERLRIARELHDVMAHTVAVISVQAGVAADVLEESPATARSALRTIRGASREAMSQLRATVGVLRAGERGMAPLAPVPGLAQLDTLIDTARGAGLDVDLTVSGEPQVLPTAIDLTAYRVVQESLTNVLRHARTSTAAVTIAYEPATIVVEVRDGGRGGAPGAEGHGITGMRERALALSGGFEAGPRPSGGFEVRVWLPTDGEAAGA